MTNTVEEIKELRHRAECAMCSMKNHMLPWLKDDGSFNDIINDMHNANSKEKLGEAYHAYIINGMSHGYSVDEIIGGIMQNDDQNKKFNVDIDSVIKSVMQIKNPISIVTVAPVEKAGMTDIEPVKEPENFMQPVFDSMKSILGVRTATKKSDNIVNESAGGTKVSNKLIKKIRGKVNYINNLFNKLKNNQSTNPAVDVNNILTVAAEAHQIVLSIDPTTCNPDELAELNDATAIMENIRKDVEGFNAVIDSAKATVQQAGVARNAEGFSINNFIKEAKIPVTTPKESNKPTQKQTVFPHQICGLTDEQLVEEVGKHFKLMPGISMGAYPLYDLFNNKLLQKKMKEFDSKQRSNNPFLTQVDINKYIDVPELLEKYSLCFTIPCNDKSKVIVVLFNPVAVPDKNGMLQYPLHILKASKSNNKSSNAANNGSK